MDWVESNNVRKAAFGLQGLAVAIAVPITGEKRDRGNRICTAVEEDKDPKKKWANQKKGTQSGRQRSLNQLTFAWLGPG